MKEISHMSLHRRAKRMDIHTDQINVMTPEATDHSSPVRCEMAPPWIPQMSDWIEIWGIWTGPCILYMKVVTLHKFYSSTGKSTRLIKMYLNTSKKCAEMY